MSTLSPSRPNSGFTIIEVLIASFLSVVVVASTWSLFISYQQIWRETSVRVEANRIASMALHRIVYGMPSSSCGIRGAGDAVLTSSTTNGWILTYSDRSNNPAGTFRYRAANRSLTYTPPIGTEQVVAQPISSSLASIQSNALSVSIEVNLTQGLFSSTRQINTTVRWRN